MSEENERKKRVYNTRITNGCTGIRCYHIFSPRETCYMIADLFISTSTTLLAFPHLLFLTHSCVAVSLKRLLASDVSWLRLLVANISAPEFLISYFHAPLKTALPETPPNSNLASPPSPLSASISRPPLHFL